MKLMKSFVVVATLLFAVITSTANAAPAWYYGTVSRIYMYNGGFIIRLNGTALDDCMHQYLYFRDSDLGETTVSRAYSMILFAEQTDREVGVVIDKAINGPGGTCLSNGSVDIQD
ncbi:MAG: hypothetical protein AAF290_07380 [Pseudomonadota bacterium]